MSEPVQVYTACQFVTPMICGQNYSQVGNKKLIHLHLNWVEVSNLTSAQLEQKLIRTCSQLGHKLYVGRKLANRAKLQHFAHFRIFSFASICKMTCQGKLPDTHRHQMKLVQKVRKQLGKQGKAVPLSSFLKNRPSVIF